jgi:CheY-like chemotaxis protein
VVSDRNVLIVDDEKALIQSIESGFEPYRDRFTVITAENGRRAVEILESHPIDLVVTDLRMPVMDGLELLAYMNSNFPNVPASVITAFRTAGTERMLRSLGVLSLLDKPVAFDDLVRCVEDGLKHVARGGSLMGVSVGAFLQLVEMERKTCLLDVIGRGGERGEFHFVDGSPIDAVCGDLKGEEAACTMIGWDNVRLRLRELPDVFIGPRKIEARLMKLLMEGLRRKDEARSLNESRKGATGLPGSERDRASAPAVRGPGGPRTALAAGSGRKSYMDEGNGLSASPHDFTREEMVEIGPRLRNSDKWLHRNRTKMDLRQVLDLMAGELDGVLTLAVLGVDGAVLAAHRVDRQINAPDINTFAAKFAILLKLATRAVEDLDGLGVFEENLVQTRDARILTRWLTDSHFLGLAVKRDGTLGGARLVVRKYLEMLRSAL